MPSPLSPVVYLPVELHSREFDAKLLLAAELARRGYAAVLGQQWMLYANLARLPPGVVLYKSFNQIHQQSMREARAAGHRIAALEEEILAQVEERAVRAMCSEGIFSAADLILCNGAFEKRILDAAATAPGRTEITGNGRIDLLKPAWRGYFSAEVDALKRRHGEFVLVNTNFSILNSIWRSVEEVTEIQVRAGFVRPNDPQSVRTWQDYIDFESANREAMVAAVRELARRRPGEKIIVRPHPGEDLSRWHGVFEALPNVSVIREGSHVPWTLACRLLLHTSCTTGYEAHVAGKTALSLVPLPGWISGSLISNKVNAVFHSPAAFVDAACVVLEGGVPPRPPGTEGLEDYIWNCAGNDGTTRIAELLTKNLPPPGPVALPALISVARDARLKEKFSMPLDACAAHLQRLTLAAVGMPAPELQGLGDSLFLVAPAGSRARVPAPAAVSPAEIGRAMQEACEQGKFQAAYETFRQNFGEAHRHGDLCFLAGMALAELGKHALALEYLQQAAVMANALQPDIAFGIARCHYRLGQLDEARSYAQEAWRMAPLVPHIFDFFKDMTQRAKQPAPAHWLVIGCSHVRYFRYLQLNQLKFFAWRAHLECYEFAGATAFGLGNEASQTGALAATRQLRPRLAQADRVMVYFGEIDCRRAAWKAAQGLGKTIEEMIAQSAARLQAYVSKEILPHNKNVVIVGAKPQIIGDEDFYRNSLEDERTVFQPLAERERITLLFNSLLRQSAERLRVQYADIDGVLDDEKSRRQFFKKAFWDAYTTDTHGNVDHFAGLYFRKLQEFL